MTGQCRDGTDLRYRHDDGGPWQIKLAGDGVCLAHGVPRSIACASRTCMQTLFRFSDLMSHRCLSSRLGQQRRDAHRRDICTNGLLWSSSLGLHVPLASIEQVRNAKGWAVPRCYNFTPVTPRTEPSSRMWETRNGSRLWSERIGGVVDEHC